jgi:uncharacterized protein (TIGR03067 family)
MSRFASLLVLCVLPGFIAEPDSAGTDRSLSPASQPLELNLAQAIGRPQRPPCLPVGRWHVEFANGVAESCAIRTDGTAVVIEPQRTAEGKITSQDGSFLIACNDDRIERWTPVGRRMVVEHWFPIAKFPVAMAVPGIGERLPAEQKELEMANKLLQGTWSAVALEEDGQKLPKEELNKQNLVLTFDGSTFRLQVGTGAYQGTFRIDPSANPKTIDFIWTRFGGGHILREETLIAQGIYQLEGETLKIRHGLRANAAVPGGTAGVFLVWGTTRPKDFMTPGAWQTTTYHCLRKTPTVPAPPLPPAPPRQPD